jgi:hypothetical protein
MAYLKPIYQLLLDRRASSKDVSRSGKRELPFH